MYYYVSDTVTPTSNPQTLFQLLAPANHRVKILGVDLAFSGSTPATAPVPFDWCTQATAGTGSPITPQYQDRGIDETKLATLQQDFTAEPTLGAILIPLALHQQGTLIWRPPLDENGRPMVLVAKGAERIGLRYKSGTFVPVTFTIYVEE